MDNKDKEKNFVSAVVYVHDDAEYIFSFIENLDKILDSNFLKYEIIIVNDRSNDNSIELIKKYTERANAIISILNMSYCQGLELAMNAGVDAAIGDFVFEFDSVYVDYDWSWVMNIYYHSLNGYDIVNAKADSHIQSTSKLFYLLFNRYAKLQYPVSTEVFRVLSRRAINRVHSMSQTIPYRKAIYAGCGLKMDTLSYQPTKKLRPKKHNQRVDLAINSLILFTDIAYRFTLGMAIVMILITIGVAVYALGYYFFNNPVEGWTTTILFLSFAFFGLFSILAMVIKYLSTLIQLNFSKKKYLFESIERI
jgi:dolichol-phosphate mannosyltransferase